MAINRKLIIYLFGIIFSLLLIYLIYLIRIKLARILTPLAIAVFISYLLMPLVLKMEKKMPRWCAILIGYILLGIIITATIVYIIPQMAKNIADLIIALPDVTLEYRDNFNRMFTIFQASRYPDEIKSAVLQQIQNSMSYIQEKIIDTLGGILNLIMRLIYFGFDLLLGMVIAFYIMRDEKKIRKSILNLFPMKWRAGVISLSIDINHILVGFIQGQLTVIIIIGILEIIGLSVVGVKYPFILGSIGGIANIIPYFGPIIGSIPAISVACLQSPIKALWAALVFVIVQQIDNAFISPKIIGAGLGLHPITVILSLIIGREFFGLLGMLLAIPAFAIIKLIARRIVKNIV